MRAARVESELSAQPWQLAGQQQRWVHHAAQLPQVPLGQLQGSMLHSAALWRRAPQPPGHAAGSLTCSILTAHTVSTSCTEKMTVSPFSVLSAISSSIAPHSAVQSSGVPPRIILAAMLLLPVYDPLQVMRRGCRVAPAAPHASIARPSGCCLAVPCRLLATRQQHAASTAQLLCADAGCWAAAGWLFWDRGACGIDCLARAPRWAHRQQFQLLISLLFLLPVVLLRLLHSQ